MHFVTKLLDSNYNLSGFLYHVFFIECFSETNRKSCGLLIKVGMNVMNFNLMEFSSECVAFLLDFFIRGAIGLEIKGFSCASFSWKVFLLCYFDWIWVQLGWKWME